MSVGHGRYGYSALPGRKSWRWPNGAGLALYVALGVEDYAFGEGRAEDILPGTPRPDLVNTAWRDYGNRVGAFRLGDRLAEYGIRPAVLLNTGVYDAAPPLVAALRKAGAEFVAHGLRNSDCLAGMAEAEERGYIAATVARIAREEGSRPTGWSSPWLAHSPRSLDLLAEQGFGYLLDLRLDDQPVWLRTRGRPLLAIPYAAELNDSTTVIGRQTSARDFADMIVDEFDEMLHASAEQPLVMSIVLHAFISGQPFRLRALSRALDHMKVHGDRLWLTRPGDIAALIARHPDWAS
jgi:peptidoglycan/xylan/chitin deacetylase (PgdA/CDA1 family)